MKKFNVWLEKSAIYKELQEVNKGLRFIYILGTITFLILVLLCLLIKDLINSLKIPLKWVAKKIWWKFNKEKEELKAENKQLQEDYDQCRKDLNKKWECISSEWREVNGNGAYTSTFKEKEQES